MNQKKPAKKKPSLKLPKSKVGTAGTRAARKTFGAVATTLLTIFLIFVITACIVAGSMAVYVSKCLDLESGIDLEYEKYNQNQTTIVYAYQDNGEPIEIQQLHGSENRRWEDLEDIPKNLQHAFVSIEDERFYTHSGVDWKRTISAFANLFVGFYGSDQGGSTITQQLVKNITKSNDVTIVRKVNEIFSALALDKENDKDKILEAYMNTLYLGSGCYGVRTASEKYFGKETSELTLPECAIIASITKSPDAYNPLRHPDKAKERQEYCLSKMRDLGYISEAEYKQAVDYKLIYTNSDEYLYANQEETEGEGESGGLNELNPEITEDEQKYQSYYIDTVISEVVDDLCEEYGYPKSYASNQIYYGGLQIYTAVDLNAQAIIDDVFENYKGFIDDSNRAIRAQASMTVMDYTGRVVCISGGAGPKPGNRCLNRAKDSPRQPGSSIKPVSAYGPGIEYDAITWASAFIDEPTVSKGGKMWPRNYSGTYSNKPTTVQNALERSLNTIPVQVVQRLGVDVCYNFAVDNLHLSTLISDGKDTDRNLSSLAVGGMSHGVTSWDMTAAFAPFGNGGVYNKPYTYYKVLDSKGDVLLEHKENPETAMSADSATIMNKLLQTVMTGPAGTGRGYSLGNQPVFAKTGTTTDVKDRWFVGGTPYYVAAVWYGYDIPKQITMSTNPAGSIWREVMKRLHSGFEWKNFKTSPGVVQATYCTWNGLLAGETCTETAVGWFKKSHMGGTCNGVHLGMEESSTDMEETTVAETTAPTTTTTTAAATTTTQANESTQSPETIAQHIFE